MTLLQRYQSLPDSIKPVAKRLFLFSKWCWNWIAILLLPYKKNINVHLGCGDEKKTGFVNIDIRTTVATDYSVDLNHLRSFAPGSVRTFYSHAFFEHLYRTQRVEHLKGVFRALTDNGVCCYIGLPYFPNIARYYLEKRKPGIVGERFDLFNVYRYTHGDPEHAPTWWLDQLHKSLFDEEELSAVLDGAGLTSNVLFVYCCVEEEGWYVSLGFYAKKGSHNIQTLKTEAKEFLHHHARNKVILDTVNFF
ncbi:MAG: hypothetical protein AB1728_07390 [Bacteroidota bacterium]